MHYSKPMVELVYEIRRRVPADMKPSIKLANPELFDELLEHYQVAATTVARALIKELFALAGEPWQSALSEGIGGEPSARQVVKIYRGQTQLEPARTPAPPAEEQRSGSREKKGRIIYRGRVLS